MVWHLSTIVIVALCFAMLSFFAGVLVGKIMYHNQTRTEIAKRKPQPVGDYIQDSIVTQESIRTDREGRRVFSTTKEE